MVYDNVYVSCHLQQHFSCIVGVSFIGWDIRIYGVNYHETCRKPLTHRFIKTQYKHVMVNRSININKTNNHLSGPS